MIRRVFLIRHAMPDIPIGERWCIGHTDLPLGPVGRMQASLLPYVPNLSGKPVFSSYLSRAVETARPLWPEPMIRDGLEEQNMGEWDGLSFTEIQSRFPVLYAARERQPDLWPEGSESMAAVKARMVPAVLRCLSETAGDIVIVSHKSAIASITGSRAKLLHTSVSVIECSRDVLTPIQVGQIFRPKLTEDVCLTLLRAAGTPEHVIAHCRAVAEETQRIFCTVTARGVMLNRNLLTSAALLHDIARTEPHHAELGAAWLRELGYPEVGNVIARHHDFTGETLDEAAVLFLSDKLVQGTQRVTLEERFAASAGRCTTKEARAAHARRFESAKKLENLISRS